MLEFRQLPVIPDRRGVSPERWAGAGVTGERKSLFSRVWSHGWPRLKQALRDGQTVLNAWLLSLSGRTQDVTFT